MLVLVANWAAAGCQDADVVPMRQFTRWAQVTGGLLAHHGIGCFLGNISSLEELDDDDAGWAQFLAAWQQILGTGWVTSQQLAEQTYDQRWAGTLPTGRGGEPLSVKALGRRLSGQKDRWHGTRALRARYITHANIWEWCVQVLQESEECEVCEVKRGFTYLRVCGGRGF